MLTIDDLRSIERPTETIELRGQSLTLRALLAGERLAIDAAYPPPKTPTIKNINTGAEIPQPDSPQHQVERQARFHAMTCAIVAVSLEMAVGGQKQTFPFAAAPAERLAWIKASADELGRVFTDDELEHLYTRIDHLEKRSFTQQARIGTENAPGN